MRRNPKGFLAAAIVIAAVNLTLFFRAPESAAIRTVHVLQLVASGILIGAALTGLARARRGM